MRKMLLFDFWSNFWVRNGRFWAKKGASIIPKVLWVAVWKKLKTHYKMTLGHSGTVSQKLVLMLSTLFSHSHYNIPTNQRDLTESFGSRFHLVSWISAYLTWRQIFWKMHKILSDPCLSSYQRLIGRLLIIVI